MRAYSEADGNLANSVRARVPGSAEFALTKGEVSLGVSIWTPRVARAARIRAK